MRILNLYAGIGGNRKLWDKGHRIVAVENNPRCAKAYKALFPDDKVIVADAHEYLLNNYDKFDFIWASPPCKTHSRIRHNLGVRGKTSKPVYPDMTLYSEILFLSHYCKAHWVVENVRPYYNPLIPYTATIGRHLFWSNFDIDPRYRLPHHSVLARDADVSYLEEVYDIDLSGSKMPDKRLALRNCVHPLIGKHIWDNLLFERYMGN